MGAGLELEVFSSGFSRNLVTGGDTVFDVEICCLADIPDDFVMSVALGYTSVQYRNRGDVSAGCFPFKDDCIALEHDF